jgi:hypothetical protein
VPSGSWSSSPLPPSPPAEKATARCYQTGQASASDRAGDGDGGGIKANNQLVPKTLCPRQTDPRSKRLAEAILPIAILKHDRKIGSRTCASASCGDIRWIRGTEMGSTHGIDSSGSTRRKHTKRYIPVREQKRGRKRGHNELSESWDSPSKLGLKAKVKSIIRRIRNNVGGKWVGPSPIQAVLHNVRVRWDRDIYRRGVTHRAAADQHTQRK